MLRGLPDSHLKYRADIDGLRALAVLGVLIFHLRPSLLTGGFVGVDVFFVISGFLITTIIWRDVKCGEFSVLRFYERRIRRIVPALFVVMVAASVAGYLWLLPDDLVSFGKSLNHAVASISNFYFLKIQSDYFEAGSSQIPLIHTWSLAVEEQFYLFFPLLLLLLHRWIKSARVLKFVVTGLIVVSLGAAIYYVDHRPMKAFFLLPFRAWEMLLGALSALMGPVLLRPRTGNFLGVLGLVLIAGGMVMFTEKMPFPGLAAMVPCVGAALIILTGRDPALWSARLLSLRPCVGLGLISYSVYLWHWPLIAFAKYSIFYREWSAPLIFVASLVLGWLSWRFVERPFRRPTWPSRKGVFGLWAAGSVALLAVGFAMLGNDGFPSRFPPEVMHFQAFKEGHDAAGNGDAAPMQERVDEILDSVRYGDLSVAPSVAMWGDSHATAMMPVIAKIASDRKICVRKFGRGGVSPIVGMACDDEKNADYSQKVLGHLVADRSLKTVILHARWSLYLEGRNENPGERSDVENDDEGRVVYAAGVRRTVEALLAAGKKVVLVYPVPEIGYSVPDYLSKCVAAGFPLPSDAIVADFHSRNDRVIAMLDGAGGEHVIRVRPYEKLMSGDRVKIRIGNEPVYRDDDHLSGPGSLYLRDLFESVF